MKARKLINSKQVFDDGLIIEVVVWDVYKPIEGSAHSFKYNFQCCYPGITLIRYDNERGKGDHKHLSEKETKIDFVSIEQLLRDFYQDVFEITGINIL